MCGEARKILTQDKMKKKIDFDPFASPYVHFYRDIGLRGVARLVWEAVVPRRVANGGEK